MNINKVQELNLKLISCVRFNSCDGKQIVTDLRKHKILWSAVLMTNQDDLIRLRDLPRDYWNVDTLFILTPRKNDKLKLLARGWNADQVSWLPRKEAEELLGEYPSNKRILSVWWD